MRKKIVKNYLIYTLCAVMVCSIGQPSLAASKIGNYDIGFVSDKATPSDAFEEEGTGAEPSEESGDKKATNSNARTPVNSLGDIWDSWSGKTSFEFLNGKQGKGTEDSPYMIKNREQLMGLSELTAMGMVVQAADGIDYAGNYQDRYFALSNHIDLQGIDWIPIGFYTDSMEMDGQIYNPFQGHFNGNGYWIKNVKISTFASYQNVGLFGSVINSEIRNLTVVPDGEKYIKGNKNVGILVGKAENSRIHDIVIESGYIESTGTAGGVAGNITATIIENAQCKNVKINGAGGMDTIYIGGIAGAAAASTIADCSVSTGNNTSSRIQGTGYVGGIIGHQNGTDIYNTQVSGTIGGRGSKAIGGITGEYSSGSIKVARFEGTIANSYLGEDAREGTFIGTRKGASSNFNYVEDIAYLFADTQSKINANVCGSGISDDNDYTYDAHIGFWHPDHLFYTLIQGGTSSVQTGQYFYEELEQGILTVMDLEGQSDYVIDHYAPNASGRPVRGYLVITEQIDTVANGQNHHDIATLKVQGSSMYSKLLDKDHRGAVAVGEVVYVNTTPNNTDAAKFQIEGTPYYKNAMAKKMDTTYSNTDHCYTFKMPEENIAVGANYKKVAVNIEVNPDVYHFIVTQTRTGNRKAPVKTTIVKNNQGKLLATYINGELQQGTQIQPVFITAAVDANNDVSDNKVRWSVDDPDLITLTKNSDEDWQGYTGQSASITLNLNSRFFTTIINQLEKDQAESNYQYVIPDTLYGFGHQNGGVAVLSAQTRPADSFEGKPCTDNCRINTTFQILDHTLVAGEGAKLDKQMLDFKVIRTLTGDRKNPSEKITVTVPQSLTATFTPDFFSKKDVIWTVDDPAVLGISQDSVAYKEASVFALKDTKWIRDLIEADQAVKENDIYSKVFGNGERNTKVTVTADDKLGNRFTASCQARVQFETRDQTRIVPEQVFLSQSALDYQLVYNKSGDINSETVSKTGFDHRQLWATVSPLMEEGDIHQPFDKAVTWTSSDPAVAVDQNGNITIVEEAKWIKDALASAPYTGAKTAVVSAVTNDGKLEAKCQIRLSFRVNCVEADRETEDIHMILTKTGKKSHPILTYTGLDSKKLNAVIYTDDENSNKVVWTSSDPSVLTVDQDGTIKPILLDDKQEVTAAWVKEALKRYPYTAEVMVKISPSSLDGSMSDPVPVNLRFSVSDQTYSGGSGGGSSSSSGGGGSSSTGVTPGGSKTATSNLPDFVFSGIWVQSADGKWLFMSKNRTFVDEWAAIHNPYADQSKGQSEFDWFRLDEEGFLKTGWFTDVDGSIYFLNNTPDGTQGRMCVGWTWINGLCYYFNPVSDGTRGRLIKSSITPDGFEVNEDGKWVKDGIVQTRQQ